jgi:hypothetical protein
VSLAVLAASPAIAWMRFVQEQGKPRAHYVAVSQELTRAWRRAVKAPLTLVASSTDFANAAAFYSGDHPKSWDLGEPQLTPWIKEKQRPRDNWAAVCPAAEEVCLSLVRLATAQSKGAIRLEFEHAATFLGRRGPPVRFVFVLVPPRR